MPPQPLCLPSTMVDTQTVAAMTKEQFSTTLMAKGTGYMYPLLPQNAVTTTKEILQIAPIAPYFVYDGFDNNLDAAHVLERILSVNSMETDCITHLKSFLMACLSAHNAGNKKLYVASKDFLAAPNVLAYRWGKKVLSVCSQP